jgi:hypothetical protein
VSDPLAPIADKLKRFVRLLSSDRDGEVVAAARAIMRTLNNAKLDVHALADAIGNGSGLTESEMRKLYDAGFTAGKHAAENGPMFRSVNLDDEPGWHDIACECAKHPHRMYGEHERNFVSKMMRKTVHGGEPTEKEARWLRFIYARVRR